MSTFLRPCVPCTVASTSLHKRCPVAPFPLLAETCLAGGGFEGLTAAPRPAMRRAAAAAPRIAYHPQRAALAATPAAHAAAAPPAVSGADGGLTVACRVVVPYHRTSVGQQLVLVGSCDQLGNWDPKNGVNFTWCEGHSHVADVELPIHTSVACKLVVVGANGSAVWEPEVDRELLLAPSTLVSRAAGYTILAHWGFPTCTQVMPNSLRRGGASPSRGRSSSSGHGHAGGRSPSPSSSSSSSGLSGGASFLAGVKKVLAQASSLDRAVIPGVSAWDQASSDEEEPEEVSLVECQVTVLVPKTGPKLRPDQSLVLVGSSPALGRWEPAEGLMLERGGEESAMWTARAELPLGEGLQAKVVVVDSVTGQAQTWEPCENRSLPSDHRGARPVMITAYWGAAPTHSLEVDRLTAASVASNPQVVAMLRQQLAATSSQLDGMRRERDDARKAVEAREEQVRHLQVEAKSGDKSFGRSEMLQLAEQLQTTRRLYETTRREAQELGGAVGITRQLCDAAKAELRALGAQVEAAKAAYEALAPAVERMERTLASTSRAFEATRPELAALEGQLERARSLFDRTLSKIEAAKALASGGVEVHEAVRRRVDNRVREMQLAKF